MPSRQYFNSLIDPIGGYLEWVRFVQAHDNYIPTVQTLDFDMGKIQYQIEAFRELSRGLVFRFELERQYQFEEIFRIIQENMSDETLCIFDAGYGDALDLKEQRVSGLINKLLEISETAKFVVSSSSFPNEFSDYDDFNASKLIGSRILHSNLAQRFGNYNLFYGDWGSTKPRRYDGGGSKPLPRIDFPTKGRWIIARSKENDWDFAEAALRVTRLVEWQDRPQVWGAGMIEKTALGLPGGISTGPEAIASRINIHLYLQNNFSSEAPPPPPQGKWEDPI